MLEKNSLQSVTTADFWPPAPVLRFIWYGVFSGRAGSADAGLCRARLGAPPMEPGRESALQPACAFRSLAAVGAVVLEFIIGAKGV